MSVLVVTGTDTDVGKTIATAAIAAALTASGVSVVVYKPTQTGVEEHLSGDVAEVERLTGVTGHDGVRLRAAMAPRPAAALEAASLPVLGDHVGHVARLRDSFDVVLVEGAGGLLVELTEAGETIADLAKALNAPVVVVVRSALGTLNHTALTLEALRHRNVRVRGLIVGAWPKDPSFIEVSNREVFDSGEVPLLGAIPEQASALTREEFCARATDWLPGLSSSVAASADRADDVLRDRLDVGAAG